jgi:hypothetical protein
VGPLLREKRHVRAVDERPLADRRMQLLGKLLGNEQAFVGGKININAELSGGFTGPAWVVLSAPADASADDIRFTNLIGVHHELSSYVVRKANALDAWTMFAPTGWEFASTSEASLARAKDGDPPPSSGFLSAYGASTAENDFNVYAE